MFLNSFFATERTENLLKISVNSVFSVAEALFHTFKKHSLRKTFKASLRSLRGKYKEIQNRADSKEEDQREHEILLDAARLDDAQFLA